MVALMDNQNRPVYITDGTRTPFLKAGSHPGPFTAADLAVAAGNQLLLRQPFAPVDVSEVIMGCVIPSSKEANIARIISLRLGCGDAVPAWTVQRNCASGLQSIDCAAQNIQVGRSELVLAGGTEAMSHAPIMWSDRFVAWLGNWNAARTWPQKIKVLTQLRPADFVPVISLLQGLADPIVGLNMGQTTENIAKLFDITREQMDEFALQSHLRLYQAQQEHKLVEISPLFDTNGHFYDRDNGVRPDSTMEKLAKIKPNFDPPYGLVTAGNSSQITDGAAMLVLASEAAIAKYRLPKLARVISVAWAGVDPAYMGLGPAYAISKLLQQTNKTLSDIDYFEINEAFAGQVLGCLAALADKKYCQEALGLRDAVGILPRNRLNIDGGSIACGHPLGASGSRLVIRLAHILREKNARYGIASLCIGGGQGGAMLIENGDLK